MATGTAATTSGRSKGLSVISSIKCSTCGKAIALNSLTTHLCEAAIAPPLPKTDNSQKWRRPSPPPKIDSSVSSHSHDRYGEYSSSDQSADSGTPSTGLTSPDSYYVYGKPSRTPSPPGAFDRSKSTSPFRTDPSGGLQPPKPPTKPLLNRLESSSLLPGPFGPKSPGLFPPSNNPWGSSPVSSRDPSPNASPEKRQPQPYPTIQEPLARKSPRVSVVDDFLKDMAQTPQFLKPENFAFSSATPNLSSGPGPAFTEDEPVSPFDFDFRPVPPRKPSPVPPARDPSPAPPAAPPKDEPKPITKIEPKTDEPQMAFPARPRGMTNPRMNQFPPPKSRKSPPPPTESGRRPSTAHSNASSAFSKGSIASKGSDLAAYIDSPPPVSHRRSSSMGSSFPLRRAQTDPEEPLPSSNKAQPPSHSASSSDPLSKRLPQDPSLKRHSCRGCKTTIMGPSLKDSSGRLSGRYHRQCFRCAHCAGALNTGDFYVHNDEPLCADHYHERAGSVCVGCNKGIEGAYAATDSNKQGSKPCLYHRDCFRCEECGSVFHGTEYWESHGRKICSKHVVMGREERRRTRFGMMGEVEMKGPGAQPGAQSGAQPKGEWDWVNTNERSGSRMNGEYRGDNRLGAGSRTGGERLAPSDRNRWM